MKEDDSHLKHEIKFLGPSDNMDPEIPYISYTFNVVFTDELLMFHICHLYHNCLQLIDQKEMTYDEIPNYITLDYIIKSVQEALDNRVKCLSASYIDDNYKWCYQRPDIFDECLDYFGKIKKELTELLNKHKSQTNLIKDDNFIETER